MMNYWLPTKVEDQLSHLKKYNVRFSTLDDILVEDLTVKNINFYNSEDI